MYNGSVTGSVQVKKEMFYLVISIKDSDGKRRQKWIATGLPEKGNRREANRLLYEKILEYQNGDVEFSKEIDFSAWLWEWLETARHTIRENTYLSYKRQINSIVKYFAEHPISVQRIGTRELNAFYHEKLKTCSPKTVKKFHCNIQLALEKARIEKIIPQNPNNDCKISSSQQKAFRASFYDADEVAKLLEVVKGEELEPVIVLTATYGLRRSEVLGLEWSAIDFSAETISIFKTAIRTQNGTVYQERTKNKSSRRVLPMSPEIKEYLLNLREYQREMKELFGNTYISDNDLVCRKKNGEIIPPDNVSRGFARILKQNNLRHIRFHDLRHSAATILINMGFTMKEVSEWLGHSDISTTMNIYAHVLDKTKVSMAAGLSASVLRKADFVSNINAYEGAC
ncbi:MAG: site-specific integrase [Oscillospiraceae bacterium]|nr:site-specific integrase [Oscillospiraceae bacterium]